MNCKTFPCMPSPATYSHNLVHRRAGFCVQSAIFEMASLAPSQISPSKRRTVSRSGGFDLPDILHTHRSSAIPSSDIRIRIGSSRESGSSRRLSWWLAAH